MTNPLYFFSDLLKRPLHEVVWVFYMMLINMAALIFWEEFLAKIIVVTFLLSSMLMMGLYSKFGFTKILGLGHILWLPLIVYMFAVLGETAGLFYQYLVVLAITILISLVIDTFDVWSYFREKRANESAV